MEIIKSGNSSQSEKDEKGSDRWNPDILNEFDCKNVFVDDAEEHLPDFFDLERIPKQKSEECAMC
jgi:hypothetical protein